MFIEKGRHFKIPREERLCQKCKVIEDEKHFLLHRLNNTDLRLNFFHFLNTQNTDFDNVTEDEKNLYNQHQYGQINCIPSLKSHKKEIIVI